MVRDIVHIKVDKGFKKKRENENLNVKAAYKINKQVS